jgi:hypothetical protein
LKFHHFVILCERAICAREGSGRATLSNLIPVLKSSLRSIKSAPSKPCSSLFVAVCSLLLISTFVSAETLTGNVKNGTNGKPAASDDVVLINLGQGMEEAARTKTDAKGNFSFNLSDAGTPHLIRAIHQGVTYHRMAPPGTTSVELSVYDAAKKVDGIGVTADVMRVQTEGNQLQVVRLFAVDNKSSPPRTQMNDHNFEFYLPEGAQVVQAMAMTAGGQPVNSSAVPQAEKNRYAFIFPLRPGETQFQVAYQLPYSGEATLNPKSIYPLQHFVVMLPKSMSFTPGPGVPFESKPYPSQPDTRAEIAANTNPGQSLQFKISGTGTLQAESQGGGSPSGGEESMAGQGRDSRPGGGLGPPIDAPDPLQKYRWYILGGFAAALALGAVFVVTRQQTAARVAAGSGIVELETPVPESTRPARSAAPARAAAAGASSGNHSSMLLEGLKEELFQLEVEHKQGRISQAEYEKAKAALDHTLDRALKRQAQKTT